MRGMAVDLRVADREPAAVRDAALGLGLGGVGYYPRPGVVHLDTGPVRRWRAGERQAGGARARVSRDGRNDLGGRRRPCRARPRAVSASGVLSPPGEPSYAPGLSVATLSASSPAPMPSAVARITPRT